MKPLKDDDSAVSPVIGEMLMVVVAVVISALVLSFSYGLLWSATEKQSVSILIEDAKPGSSNITIVHVGGKPINNAFIPTSHLVNDTIFNNLVVKINGSTYEGWASLNSGEISKPDFEVGDELKLDLDWKLHTGDSIAIVHTSTGDVIAWMRVR